MAAGTLAASLEAEARVRHARLTVESVVALQAELAAFTPHQQHAIGAAVRIVAGSAAFYLCRRMLVDAGSALFHMALDASLKVRFVEAGQVRRAVRVVAVRTLHQVLRHAVMNGQRELSLNRPVTSKTKRWLGLLQQAVMQPANLIRQARRLEEIALRVAEISFALIFDFFHQMSGVALVARQTVRSVRRMFEEFLLLAADMTKQTVGRVFLRVGAKVKDGKLLQRSRNLLIDAEGEDGMLLERVRGLALVTLGGLNGIGVSFPRPVTDLAARDVTLAGNGHFAMSRLFIFGELWLKASPALIGAGIITGAGLEEGRGYRRALRRLGHLLCP